MNTHLLDKGKIVSQTLMKYSPNEINLKLNYVVNYGTFLLHFLACRCMHPFISNILAYFQYARRFKKYLRITTRSEYDPYWGNIDVLCSWHNTKVLTQIGLWSGDYLEWIIVCHTIVVSSYCFINKQLALWSSHRYLPMSCFIFGLHSDLLHIWRQVFIWTNHGSHKHNTILCNNVMSESRRFNSRNRSLRYHQISKITIILNQTKQWWPNLANP